MHDLEPHVRIILQLPQNLISSTSLHDSNAQKIVKKSPNQKYILTKSKNQNALASVINHIHRKHEKQWREIRKCFGVEKPCKLVLQDNERLWWEVELNLFLRSGAVEGGDGGVEERDVHGLGQISEFLGGHDDGVW